MTLTKHSGRGSSSIQRDKLYEVRWSNDPTWLGRVNKNNERSQYLYREYITSKLSKTQRCPYQTRSVLEGKSFSRMNSVIISSDIYRHPQAITKKSSLKDYTSSISMHSLQNRHKFCSRRLSEELRFHI